MCVYYVVMRKRSKQAWLPGFPSGEKANNPKGEHPLFECVSEGVQRRPNDIDAALTRGQSIFTICAKDRAATSRTALIHSEQLSLLRGYL